MYAEIVRKIPTFAQKTIGCYWGRYLEKIAAAK
jgi:hypothetical protein